MGGVHIWFFIVATAIIACTNCTDYNIESILEQVPENERTSFLKHYIILGYELSENNVDKNKILLHDPIQFSIEVYKKYRKDHLVKTGRRVTPYENIICFPNGECIDIDDPGVHPFN